jgi:hypothetical protein
MTKAKPILELLFYSYGIVRRHNTERGSTETIVAPADLAKAINSRPHNWETGLLTPNTLYMGEIANTLIVVEYRKPQYTGIWLEDTAEPVRVPMPGLILIRLMARKDKPDYKVFAVKRRLHSMNQKLYVSPLPNTFTHGGICWGSVPQPNPDDMGVVDLAADWKMLLGSPFNNHAVGGKSKKHRSDVRKLLFELQKAEKYPLNDLVEAGTTLAMVLKRVGER